MYGERRTKKALARRLPEAMREATARRALAFLNPIVDQDPTYNIFASFRTMQSDSDSDVDMDDAEVARYRALIPHVFLPPRLPVAEEAEDDLRETSLLLCQVLLDGAKVYKDNVREDQRSLWSVVVAMIENVKAFVDAPMTQASLAATLEDMDIGGTCPSL